MTRASARRYAQAVFELALEKKEVDKWQSDLAQIASVVGDATVTAALENPRIPLETKARLLSEQLKEVSPLALNLVKLLIMRGSIDIIGEIETEFQRLLNRHRGIEPAEVITAVPLDDETERQLTKSLGDIVGKKVILKSEVDPDVIGGVIARIGGKLLDGSTRSSLAALKRELAGMGR